MKFLGFLLIIISPSFIIAETLVCDTGPEAVPRDVFFISLEGERTSSIKYQRNLSRVPDPDAALLPVPRCAPVSSALILPNEIYIECEGDGDAGYLSLTLVDGKFAGTITFPEESLGYDGDTSLELSCSKSPLR